MSVTILSWCKGSPCDPCPPPLPPPSTGNGGGLPPFTDGAVNINQVQVATDLSGGTTNYALGSMIIYSAIDNIPPQGAFGTPLSFGPPETSSVAGVVVVYESVLQILHPWQPAGSYDGNLPTITSGPLSDNTIDPTGASNAAASAAAGNAATVQANQVLGNI
jgi:hypothetical protein